jgi:hypothetical protein
MIRKLARKILKDDIDAMSETIESLRESNNTLRKEVDDFADVKLRLKVAEMYIDDNDAIDELLAAKKAEETVDQRYRGLIGMAASREMRANAGMFGHVGMPGMVGASCSNFGSLSGGRYG